jgi:hypothetical protein
MTVREPHALLLQGAEAPWAKEVFPPRKIIATKLVENNQYSQARHAVGCRPGCGCPYGSGSEEDEQEGYQQARANEQASTPRNPATWGHEAILVNKTAGRDGMLARWAQARSLHPFKLKGESLPGKPVNAAAIVCDRLHRLPPSVHWDLSHAFASIERL